MQKAICVSRGDKTASDSIFCVIVRQQQGALSDNNRGHGRYDSIPDTQDMYRKHCAYSDVGIAASAQSFSSGLFLL